MNRTELVRTVASKTGLPSTTVKAVLEASLNAVSDTIGDGEAVEIRGFGKFELRVRAPVARPNPRTGQTMTIPERITVTFLPSSTLKGRLNG